MNSILKNSALAVMLSLAMATTAKATQPDSNTTISVKPGESQSLVAQMRPRSRFDATRTRPFIDEMIMLHMEMVDAAQRAMQSPDPQVRSMAEETMKSSNAQISTLLEMRRKFFENPDKG
jgi:uncharacterized protein (DUF305 family)